MKSGNILIVDDNRGILTALELLLSTHFKKITTLSHPDGVIEEMAKEQYDVVLLDMNFNAEVNSGNEGFFWLNQIRESYREVSVVMFTAYGDVELAVRAVKEGAVDFILKPWNNAKLIITLKSAVESTLKSRKIEELSLKEVTLKQALNPGITSIIGKSKPIKSMLKIVERVSASDAGVLVTGENGTGKELVARAIHSCSKRVNEPMISVDMGSIPETLFESELFGHVKGAFTDAKDGRAGKIEASDGGTLFLDEIGNLPLNLQAKLLTAIQQQTIYRVGSNKPIHVNFRLVCATNSDLFKMVEDGRFREDLLYRINTIQIEVPPLRDRGRDIILITDHYLNKFALRYQREELSLSQGAIDKLLNHSWPGNVRELEHAIEKAVILSESDLLDESLFWFNKSSKVKSSVSEGGTIAEMERALIESVLNKSEYNFSAAAKELGVTRQTLYNKMKRYDI